MKKHLKYLKNKYVIASLFLLIWLLFFDNYDFFTLWETKNKLHESKQRKKFYKDEIKKARERLHLLQHDSAALEKYAREKYLMKKEGEDIFVVVEENDSLKKE
ncbi:MAG: septum formation initiator family protein [Flavobacteriales bacterium]